MKIDIFEKQLNNYVQCINQNYNGDRIEGMFFLVQSYAKGKIDVYNRHTFYEHYNLSSLRDYCQNKLVNDWLFEYGTDSSEICCKIYICCYCKESSSVMYRGFAEGHFKDKKFIYMEI